MTLETHCVSSVAEPPGVTRIRMGWGAADLGPARVYVVMARRIPEPATRELPPSLLPAPASASHPRWDPASDTPPRFQRDTSQTSHHDGRLHGG